MKNSKYFIALAIFAAGLVASCTPESIQDEQAPQQIDPWTVKVPTNG